MSKLIAGISRVVSIILLVVIILSTIIIAANKLLPHGPLYLLTVRTGSMKPTMPVGSLVVSKRMTNYIVGDIITFRRDNILVSHRIVEPFPNGFKVKGDANNAPDTQIVQPNDVTGKVIFIVPNGGRVLTFIKTPLGFCLLVLLPSLLIIIQEIFAIGRELERMRMLNQHKFLHPYNSQAHEFHKTLSHEHEKKETKASQQRLGQAVSILLVIFVSNVGGTKAFFSDIGKSLNNTFSAGQFIANHLVINEIFFFVDTNHGKDCAPNGGGIGDLNVNVNVNNTNTGEGSNQITHVDATNNVSNSESNKTDITNTINLDANTGDVNVDGNTHVGDVSTGDINVNLNISNNVNDANGQCDEWVELYNPTSQDINLKNWAVVDNAHTPRVINANKTIKAGKFALLVKSKSTFSKFWDVPAGTQIIELGSAIGDGLSNNGDHLQLFNPAHAETDTISWGTDSLIPHYAGPVAAGSSIERFTPGLDTNNGTDFTLRNPPTPAQ